MKFILKTPYKTYNLWGEYIDEQEPISIYKEPLSYTNICPYNPPQPLMILHMDKVLLFYTTNRPKIKNWTLSIQETTIKPYWVMLRDSSRGGE